MPETKEETEKRIGRKITRQCGSCTLCCKTFPVEALNKPADVWCSHAKKGGGCAIYESRPGECQVFYCMWLTYNDVLGVDERPDKTGVVFSIHPDPTRFIHMGLARDFGRVILAQEQFSGAIRKPRAMDIVRRFVGYGLRIVVPDIGEGTGVTAFLPRCGEVRLIRWKPKPGSEGYLWCLADDLPALKDQYASVGAPMEQAAEPFNEWLKMQPPELRDMKRREMVSSMDELQRKVRELPEEERSKIKVFADFVLALPPEARKEYLKKAMERKGET
jgi:hypothetical protein